MMHQRLCSTLHARLSRMKRLLVDYPEATHQQLLECVSLDVARVYGPVLLNSHLSTYQRFRAVESNQYVVEGKAGDEHLVRRLQNSMLLYALGDAGSVPNSMLLGAEPPVETYSPVSSIERLDVMCTKTRHLDLIALELYEGRPASFVELSPYPHLQELVVGRLDLHELFGNGKRQNQILEAIEHQSIPFHRVRTAYRRCCTLSASLSRLCNVCV
jgi:hypothetical protein